MNKYKLPYKILDMPTHLDGKIPLASLQLSCATTVERLDVLGVALQHFVACINRLHQA